MVELPAWIPLINRLVGVCIFWLMGYAIGQQKRITQEIIKTATLQIEHKALQLREQLLEKSSREFQDLYDYAPCGYHSLNADGVIVDMNQTELDWLGYTEREIVGTRRFSDFLIAPQKDLFENHCSRLPQVGALSGLEFDVMRRNGSTIPILLNATSVKDPENLSVSSRWTLVDITDRRRAEEVLRHTNKTLEQEVKARTEDLQLSNIRLERELLTTRQTQAALESTEIRFQLMANHAPVLIWISDISKNCIWFNDPWLRFVGHTLEEELGNGRTYNVHPDDLNSYLKAYESSFDLRHPFITEYRMRRHDGEWRWLQDHGVPRFEAGDQFMGFIGCCTDITEQKTSLAAARESEERLSGIFSSAMDAIITVNEGQNITHFNKAAEIMFGCPTEQAIGQPISKFIPERFRAAHGSHVTAFGQTSISKRQMGALGTIFGLRTNGQEFPIEAAVSQMISRGRKLFTVILRDISQRQQTEDALKVSEARFRELLEYLPELIWTGNPDGTFNYLSPQWAAYTGIPGDKQLGMNWAYQVHVDDRRKLTEQWQAGISSGQPFRLEFRIRGANRHFRWFQTHATPIRDSVGKIVKWLGISTDIDDRKQGETMRAHLSAIVESSSDAIISKSLDGSILTWNRSAEKMFGYSAEEIIGRSVTTLLPETRRHEESKIVAEIKTGKHLPTFESIRMGKDGKLVNVSLTISPIIDTTGAVIGISTIARDITTKKETEELLHQQRRLIELSHEPIFAWDTEHGIVEWNKGCEQLYGYSREEAIGQISQLLLHTKFSTSFQEIQAVLDLKGDWTGEVRHRTKSGEELIVRSRLSMLRAADRNLILETNRDVTQQQLSEEIILKKNKDLETLLYVTSHDLKEPLRSIESFSVLIQERYATRLDEKGQDFLRRIVRATQRLDQLLTDILDLSRAQRMDAPLHDVEGDLLVQEVLRRLENRIKQTKARITIHSPLPRFRVNTTWATQGIYNLVANALKFVPAGQPPDVEISSYSEVNAQGIQHAGLIVQDRGQGIPPDQQERIFELFRRAVGREVEGTGAGLAIVRQVAERHGGRAWVTSRDGGGSNFYITFGEYSITKRGTHL
ncbi:MAG: PAS domain S-box protein [Nitrospira sp.]|nr:PAS domain S-box protein [Nitrospira sp.]